MTQLLQLDNNLAVRFGGNQAFMIVTRRLAEVFKVSWSEADQWPDVRGSLMQAAQWMWSYGAMPGKHIWMLPFNKEETREENGRPVKYWRKTYAVSDSYEWRKASADDKAREMRMRYGVPAEEIPTEQLQKLMARNGLISENKLGPYHTDDIGFRARVILFDQAKEYKFLGMEYNPPWHYGFWRKFAKNSSGKWEPDNVPTGRTREWVAMKRAEKSALAEHFELRPLPGWSRLDDRSRLDRIEQRIAEPPPREAEAWPTVEAEGAQREENGDILFA